MKHDLEARGQEVHAISTNSSNKRAKQQQQQQQQPKSIRTKGYVLPAAEDGIALMASGKLLKRVCAVEVPPVVVL